MSLLATTDDAEQAARAWMQKTYGKRLGRVMFVEVTNDNGVWNVRADVKLAVGLLLIKPHMVRVKIDPTPPKSSAAPRQRRATGPTDLLQSL